MWGNIMVKYIFWYSGKKFRFTHEICFFACEIKIKKQLGQTIHYCAFTINLLIDRETLGNYLFQKIHRAH